jgi:signal transduction histidine kinase
MPCPLNSNSIWHSVKSILFYTGLAIVFFLFHSCNPPEISANNAGYDKVLDTASQVFDSGNPKKAIHYLDSATTRFRNFNISQKYYYYQYHYNYYYHINNSKDEALLYADSMLNLFDTRDVQLKNAPLYGQASFFKGDLLFDEGKFADAYQYYYQGKMAANNTFNDCTMGDYTYRMGMIMYKQEHYRLAAAYFRQSSEQTNTCDWTFRSFYRRQELLSNTGLSYSKINELDSATMFYEKALKYIDSTGIQFHLRKDLLLVARAVIYGNEADIYIEQKNYRLASTLLKKSISVNLMWGNDNHDAQLSELKLAHIYEQENKPDSLIVLLGHVHLQFDSIKNEEAEADWNMLMSDYYVKKNDTRTAFGYLMRFDLLKDSINNRNKMLKEADVTQQMKRLEKNYEFTELKKNNKLQHLYLSIAVVFGVMLLLIISLILSNWRKSRRNIKVLDSLNNKIKDQNHNLEQALSELNMSSLEKDRILRTVAHDLRNPLGGVASLAGLMAAESEYTDDQKELINLIKETSNNSIELINEILDATENSQTKSNREKELVEINALLGNSVDLLRFKAAEKNQQIILELLETPVELFIAREKIWRVISNLISNAIKFSRQNSLILVKLTDNGDQVTISVKDNGIGIPDDIKDNIFNMFTDAKRPGTDGEKSFGLGLSICKQIIENHNGKIWFESEANKGSAFFIRLNKPAAKA